MGGESGRVPFGVGCCTGSQSREQREAGRPLELTSEPAVWPSAGREERRRKGVPPGV